MDRARDESTDHLVECSSVVPGFRDVCGECGCWCHLAPAHRAEAYQTWRAQQDLLAMLEETGLLTDPTLR